MAEERKKPKIDLKTRIPSKTVKGLTPVAGGAIPPPPGAVPAPPPDLLGRRSMPPKVSADPNDPLGAAHGAQPQQQQIVVVAAAEDGVGAASKKGVFYAIIAGSLIVGLGVGFLGGQATKGGEVASKAKQDAKELQDKVTKTNENLGKLLDTLKAAQSELANTAQLKPTTITALKEFNIGLSVNDLKGRQIAYFGEETAGKLYTYANKVAHIDQLRAMVTKSNALENANAQIKAFTIPKDHAKWGVKVSKASAPPEPQITQADLVDFGDPVNLKDKAAFAGGPKDPKLKVKSGELEIWPGGKTDFFEKNFISAIDAKDWLKACPVYAQALGYTKQSLDEIVVAIDGAGDDPGTLKPGKELGDKLKSLAK